jgi:hypothetical protein
MNRTRRVLFGLMLFCLASSAEAAERDGPHARALRRECDQLLARVVKKPYGWGWPADGAAGNEEKPNSRETVVSLEPLQTPAAALMLLFASDVLNEPDYALAARHVGRLVAASVQSSGQIPSHIAMGTRLLNREKPRPLPDRASTRASTALLLSIVQGKKEPEELFTRAAGRGAGWLVKQQPRTGAWPIVYPPDAEPKDTVRLVRLDTPDTRDNLLAMLLAYDVLGDESSKRSIDRSISFLLRVRNPEEQKVGGGMFGPCFDAGGGAMDKMEQFPIESTDCLASRYAIEAMFCAYIVAGEKEWEQAARLAATSAANLPRNQDGRWHRWYTPRADPIRPSALLARRVGFEDAPDTLVGDWGLPSTIEIIKGHDQLGREAFLKRLTRPLTVRQRLVLTVCGLLDEPMRIDVSTAPELKDASDGEFAGTVRKLWGLYLQARLERDSEPK